MSPTLKTKNVFLTGGAQGLGKSYMDALLGLGAKVVFGDVNSEIGATTEKEMKEKHGSENVKFVAFDVTDLGAFEAAFKGAVVHLGYIDLMVNNAGIMREDIWEKMIEINYKALVKGTMLAQEHMRQDRGGKGGRIINISSILGLDTTIFAPIYCGLKHAVRGFTESLAISPDLKQQNIEFGVLCPGATDTALVRAMDNTNVHYLDTVSPEVVKAVTSTIEYVQQGFVKLVTLEEMNGALLLVDFQGTRFVTMGKTEVGPDWPVAPTSPDNVSQPGN